MSEIGLTEAAARAGVAYALIRKHAQRGKLKVRHEGARVLVDEADLEAYLAAERLSSTLSVVPPTADGFRDLGNVIGNLPPRIQTAILEGMPGKKGNAMSPGSPEPYRKAVAKEQAQPAAMVESDDPHFGRPIGYQHRSSPRWKRISASTWELDGATFRWDGFAFVGGGLREGKIIELPITPAHPDAGMRPLAPSRPVSR